MAFYYEKLDHVQLTAPKDEEQTAKAIYVHVLGFKEMNKPENLQKNGGIWLQSGDVHIHICVEEPFVPARKAHPAIYVKHLDELKQYLQDHDVAYLEDERWPNYKRFYVSDPFGNRLEFLEKS